MKRSKIPQNLAKNASKQHKLVGELLTSDESPYKGFDIRQEYRVSKVNPNFKSNREKFDWVILKLNVVIEVHGLQHFKPVCFGGIDLSEADCRFRKQVRIDEQKKTAADEAGWTYIVFKHNESITLEEIQRRIGEAM